MGIYSCHFKSSATGNSLFSFHQILKWLLIILIQFSFIMILCKMIYAGEDKLINRAKADLRAWKVALEMYYVDWIKYPKANSIDEIAYILASSGYWDKPVVKDPWGNLYQYSANSNFVEIKSLGEDGIISSDDIIELPSFKALQTKSPSQKENSIAKPNLAIYNPSILNPGTTIMLSKSGNDIVISWTQISGQTYDIVRATDKQFFNAVTLVLDLIGNSYIYANGLINNRNIEFFDVTDDTETNRGSENNGGDPPPQPPVVAVSPSGLYIGISTTVNGTGFSTVKDDNSIWFSGGVKANVTNATATQLDFVVPAGAVSGNYHVTIGGALTSEPISGPVFLDDSAQPWTMARTIGYSELTGSYWGGGNWGGNRLVEMKYNNSTGKWEKSNKTGNDPNFVNSFLYCSTKTDSSGRIFCGKANLSISAARTGYADTVAETVLQNCRVLSPDGEKQQHVIGAAADPDPDRNLAYFAYSYIDPNTSVIYNYIYKVQSDCSSIIDNNYGNTNGTVFNFPSIVGMAVDRDGVLYISEGSQITKIWQDEYGEHYEAIKTGFNNLLGIDVKQASPGGPVFIIGAEFGADRIIAFSTDNPSAPVDLIPPGSGINARTVAWSQSVFDEWSSIKRKRNTWVYNRGNTLISIEGDYRLMVEPVTMEDGRAWISSPVASDMPPYQTQVRASDPAATGYSTIVTRAWWRDGIARQLCAYSGDPRSSAPYEPAPGDTTLCDRPRDIAGAICDNKEDFSSTGPGSFVINNSYNYCFPLGCGTNENNACEIELRISQRYAGDNYKVYFMYQDEVAQQTIMQATGNLTSWKHIHIEKDKMCKGGGIIKQAANSGSQIIYLAMNENGSVADNVAEGNIIHIFDSEKHLDTNHDKKCVKTRTEEPGNKRVIIELANEANCNQAQGLFYSYDADDNGDASDPWDFNSGKSAGVCVEGSAFYESDTSELRQAYNDGFVSFHIPMQIANGAGVVPYLPVAFFDGAFESRYRFQQIWFTNKRPKLPPDPDYDNYESNYWHLLGASERTNAAGITRNEANASFVFIASIEDPFYCSFTGPLARACNANEIQYHIRHTAAHELVHEFAYDSDEIATDWAWCGDSLTPNTFQCDHPDGVPPNNNYLGQYCIMSPMLAGDEDRTLAMRTDNVHHLDCALLYGQVCHNEPAGRPSLREQIDPQ